MSDIVKRYLAKNPGVKDQLQNLKDAHIRLNKLPADIEQTLGFFNRIDDDTFLLQIICPLAIKEIQSELNTLANAVVRTADPDLKRSNYEKQAKLKGEIKELKDLQERSRLDIEIFLKELAVLWDANRKYELHQQGLTEMEDNVKELQDKFARTGDHLLGRKIEILGEGLEQGRLTVEKERQDVEKIILRPKSSGHTKGIEVRFSG